MPCMRLSSQLVAPVLPTFGFTLVINVYKRFIEHVLMTATYLYWMNSHTLIPALIIILTGSSSGGIEILGGIVSGVMLRWGINMEAYYEQQDQFYDSSI